MKRIKNIFPLRRNYLLIVTLCIKLSNIFHNERNISQIFSSDLLFSFKCVMLSQLQEIKRENF